MDKWNRLYVTAQHLISQELDSTLTICFVLFKNNRATFLFHICITLLHKHRIRESILTKWQRVNQKTGTFLK